MKIAVLGGSFNPIHIGHLILADCVCKELGYDKILFIPTFIPPHKHMTDEAPAKDRLAMVKKAIAGDRRFVCESYEIDRGGVSYTWDTVCYLEEKYKGKLDGKIGLIIGFDLAPHFDRWEKAEQLAQKCQIILANRPQEKLCRDYSNQAKSGYDTEIEDFSEKDFKFPHINLDNPAVQLSSTDIRRRISTGKAFNYLVSKKVFNYIKKRNLYGFKSE